MCSQILRELRLVSEPPSLHFSPPRLMLPGAWDPWPVASRGPPHCLLLVLFPSHLLPDLLCPLCTCSPDSPASFLCPAQRLGSPRLQSDLPLAWASPPARPHWLLPVSGLAVFPLAWGGRSSSLWSPHTWLLPCLHSDCCSLPARPVICCRHSWARSACRVSCSPWVSSRCPGRGRVSSSH